MALEKIDGVSAALVNRDITLLLDHESAPNAEELAEVLKPFKMQVKAVSKAETLPF